MSSFISVINFSVYEFPGRWSPQAFPLRYGFARGDQHYALRKDAQLLEPDSYLKCYYTSESKASMQIPVSLYKNGGQKTNVTVSLKYTRN